MRVLLINKYWRHAGGVEVHAFEVKEWLESRGHHVEPFAMRESDTLDATYRAEFPEDVDFRGSSIAGAAAGLRRATLSSDSVAGLRKVVAEFQPDVAYVLHVYHQLGTRVLNELEQLGVPMILSLHDYKVACANYRLFSEKSGSICTRCVDNKFAPFYAPVTEACWNGSRAAGAALILESISTKIRKSYIRPQVVTVLNDLQVKAAEVAGIRPSRVQKIPHPVPLFPDRADVSRSRFLYLGRLVPEKGVDVLIRAVARAGVSLDIAGEGREREALESLSREEGADVAFVGNVAREKVPQLLRSAAALVVPSTWHEVSPLVVYEAIAHDVPVIGTAVGGMVDQLGAERGFLVAPGSVDDLAQALRQVCDEPSLAARRSRTAREYARHAWTREAWEQNMIDAFGHAGVAI